MNRLARVVAQGKHSVTLQLQKTEKCAGCTRNCNQPLLNLFGMHKNVLTLSLHHKNYLIKDSDELLTQKLPVGYPVALHITEQDLYQFSGIFYLLPLLACVFMLSLGHVMGNWLGYNNELTALLGLLIGFLLVYMFFKSELIQQHLKFRPLVTILDKKGTNN